MSGLIETPLGTLPIPGGPTTWESSDRVVSSSSFELSEELQLIILEGADLLLDSSVPLQALSDYKLDCPELQNIVGLVDSELCEGSGFALITGFPVTGVDDAKIRMGFALFMSRIGRLVSQNASGDLVGEIADVGTSMRDGKVRGYQTNELLPFHTDPIDIVSLLCVNPALEGGVSSIASAHSIIRFLIEEAPEMTGLLLDEYNFDRRGEQGPGEQPTYRMPLARYVGGEWSVRLVADYIRSGHSRIGRPLSAVQEELFSLIQKTAGMDRFRIDMNLRRGDIQLLHNNVVFHSRTEFSDGPDESTKRRMLRCWINQERGRPVPEEFAWRRLGVAPLDPVAVGEV